jgi:hypothetical protein
MCYPTFVGRLGVWGARTLWLVISFSTQADMNCCWKIIDKDSVTAILLLIYSTALGAEWTVRWSGGEGLQSHPTSPAPIMQAEKNKVFFFGASLLNAQRSPDFGQRKGIIIVRPKKISKPQISLHTKIHHKAIYRIRRGISTT